MAEAAESLAKGRRLAEQATRIDAIDYELVIEACYYAMHHAARAVVIAAEGDASTNHGRIIRAFARVVRRLGIDQRDVSVAALQTAYDLRLEAMYRAQSRDLREEARQLVLEAERFLALCEGIVAGTASGGAPGREDDRPS